MIRYLILVLLVASCSFTVQPEDLPPSFYGIDAAAENEIEKSAWLGVELSLLQSEDVFSLDVQPGVLVDRVAPESPAAIGGIQVGDIILSYDGHPTDDPQRIQSLLSSEVDERHVELEIQRGSEVLVASLKLEIKTDSVLRSKYFVERGLVRAAFTDNDEGYPQIAALDADSPLLNAGAKVGDLIVLFQGDDPGSSFELVRRIRLGVAPGQEIVLKLLNADGAARKLSFKAWQPQNFVTEVGLWPLFYWQRSPGLDKGVFTLGNLVLIDLFSYKRDGLEREYSIAGVFHWKTGELILEEE